MVTVRTTMQPDTELEVDQREADSLRNMGLLVDSDVHPAPAPGTPEPPAEKQEEDSAPSRSSQRSSNKK